MLLLQLRNEIAHDRLPTATRGAKQAKFNFALNAPAICSTRDWALYGAQPEKFIGNRDREVPFLFRHPIHRPIRASSFHREVTHGFRTSPASLSQGRA